MAVVALVFGDGVVRVVANAFAGRFTLNPRPFVDNAGTVHVGISHGKDRTQVLHHVSVVVPQWLPFRLFRLLRFDRVPRHIIVARLLAAGDSRDLEPDKPVVLEAKLPATEWLPTWDLRKSRVPRELMKVRRLQCVIHVGRHRMMVASVDHERAGRIPPAA